MADAEVLENEAGARGRDESHAELAFVRVDRLVVGELCRGAAHRRDEFMAMTRGERRRIGQPVEF